MVVTERIIAENILDIFKRYVFDKSVLSDIDIIIPQGKTIFQGWRKGYRRDND